MLWSHCGNLLLYVKQAYVKQAYVKQAYVKQAYVNQKCTQLLSYRTI